MFKKLLRSKTIQRRTQLLLAVVMIPPFVFFFHLWAGNRPGAGPGGTAGEIFGRPIPWETFQEYHQLMRKALEAQLGTIPDGFEPVLVQQTWDRLILREEARRQIRLTDADLARHLRTQSTFQRNGRFAPELYDQYVRALGTTPQAFEEKLRDELRVQRLVERVKAETAVSEEDIRRAYARDHDRLRVAFVSVHTSDFEAAARQALTDDDRRAYVSAHAAWFSTPPQRAIRYVGRTPAEAAAQAAPVTEEAIAQAYDQRPEAFAPPGKPIPPLEQLRETIRTRLQDEHAQRALTDFALDVQEDVEAGLKLEAMAASRGVEVRELASVAQGDAESGLPPEAIAAAFEVPVGQLTRVVQTAAGVFLLEPTHEIPARPRPFDDVKAQAADRLTDDRAREAARARAAQVREQLLAKQTTGVTFAEAAASLGLTVQHPEPFTRLSPIGPLGQAPSVAEALRAAPIGKITDALEAPSGWVIAVVEARLPFEEAAFAKDHDGVRAGLLAEQQEAHVMAWMTSLRANARLKSFLERPAK